MKNILIIVGSLRTESINKKLALIIKEKLEENKEIKVDFLNYQNVPLYNEDNDYFNDKNIIALKEKVDTYDALWLVTPEYNFSYPGVLKNLLDHLSRPISNENEKRVLINKKVFVSGVAGKSKAFGARKNLNDLLKVLRMNILTSSNEIGIELQPNNFINNSLPFNEENEKLIANAVKDFINFINND